MSSEYIKAYEYESNVNPPLKGIPIVTKNIEDCNYGINFIDFSDIYNVKHYATSPNLLASFIKIEGYKEFESESECEKKNNWINGSSNLFFIMKGNCEIITDSEINNVSSGDIIIIPLFNSLKIKNNDSEEVYIYYINDSPLINYLGCKPVEKTFKLSIYSKEFIMSNLIKLSNPHNNRKGILLSNEDTEKIGVNTITPVLWSLYNELPPQTNQRPHKHNSVALDLCISCSDSTNIYTLIGDKLDENNKIINPKKVHWKPFEMFITPPDLWHSHHNDGNSYAYILPIQDAGILLYQRILGIVLK
jgi:gentisate 1,2-dioxygenase